MRKVFYYIMLLVFSVCVVWNALRKHDSIMGVDREGAQQEPLQTQGVAAAAGLSLH
ncbi:MAG TPA: hypothetical protein VNU93_03620 [Verrucomicrobiae bacterium]|nr:hypothetical protein [Verrucomicrobiae bacterium]